MIQAVYPVVFMLVGAAAYIVATNGKVQELGRLLFLAGSIAAALALAGRALAL